ncbi:MAG: hypothetical protein WAT93_04655 [Pontixanthobacter sp.]
MKILRSLAVLPLFAAACCAPVPQPTPTPTPVLTSAPTPTPSSSAVSPSAYENWPDAPQTLGDWSYTDGNALSYATFGQPGQAARFGVECQKGARTIRLVRGTGASEPMPMRIRTETTERLLTAQPDESGRPMLIARLPASDSLLDAIALSRGRFAVETGGLETLYLPSWPEITRVIEDCR